MEARRKGKGAGTVVFAAPKAVWSVYLIEDFGDGRLCTSHREDFPSEADAWTFAHSEADLMAGGEIPQFVCENESITFAIAEHSIRTFIVVRRVKMEVAGRLPPHVAND